MTRLRVLDDADAVARHAADALVWRIGDARQRGHEVHIALAGGNTPRRAYELMALIEGSWDHVHLWLGDERCVPDGHPDSNARMVRESLYAHARAEPSVLHPVDLPEVPEDAAWLYGLQMRDKVPDMIFDVVLLGMGPDGHTASLFAGHPALKVTEAPCVPVREAPKAPPERITLSLPVLRGARHTLMLVTGAEKADALARVLAGDESVPTALLGDGLDEIACDRAAAPEGGAVSSACRTGKVTLARHAETEWSLSGQHTGHTDIPLTDGGREKARALAGPLSERSFDRVLTSPLSRAAETAKLAGFPDAEHDPDLMEWDYGDDEGLTTPQIREQRGDADWLLWHDGAAGGEAADDVGSRVDRVIARVTEGDREVLIFAHGHVLRVLAARWLEQPADHGSRLVLGTGTLSVLGYEHDVRAILSWNAG